MTISRANGLDIYYETAGAGPPLVLIHALPFDHNLWLYQVERFSARFRTVAMDLRGWGLSAKPTTPFSLDDMGKDILGVLADAGIANDVVVLGCSIGSKISLKLACEHPEVFRAAILVGGNSGPQLNLIHRAADYRAHSAAGTLGDYHLGHLRYGVTREWADTPIGRYLLDGFAHRGRGSRCGIDRPGLRGPHCLGSHAAAADLQDPDFDRQWRARHRAPGRYPDRGAAPPCRASNPSPHRSLLLS